MPPVRRAQKQANGTRHLNRSQGRRGPKSVNMLPSSLIHTHELGHNPVWDHGLQALADAAGGVLPQRLDVLQTAGALNVQTSAWIRSAVPQRSSLSADTAADIAEPQVYDTSFEPQDCSGQPHVSRNCTEMVFEPS